METDIFQFGEISLNHVSDDFIPLLILSLSFLPHLVFFFICVCGKVKITFVFILNFLILKVSFVYFTQQKTLFFALLSESSTSFSTLH